MSQRTMLILPPASRHCDATSSGEIGKDADPDRLGEAAEHAIRRCVNGWIRIVNGGRGTITRDDAER